MKWIKPYKLFEEYSYDTDLDFYATDLITSFNNLFRNIGIHMELKESDNNMLSFKVCINFAEDRNMLDTVMNSMMPENLKNYEKITNAFPKLHNGNYTDYTIIEFYKEWVALGDIINNREVNNGREIRKYKKHLRSGKCGTYEKNALQDSIFCLGLLFTNMSSNLVISDSLSMPTIVDIPLFRNVVVNYINYIKKNFNPNLTEPPDELYRIIIKEVCNYSDSFKLINRLKKTELYAILKPYGDIESLDTGEQMGELGF